VGFDVARVPEWVYQVTSAGQHALCGRDAGRDGMVLERGVLAIPSGAVGFRWRPSPSALRTPARWLLHGIQHQACRAWRSRHLEPPGQQSVHEVTLTSDHGYDAAATAQLWMTVRLRRRPIEAAQGGDLTSILGPSCSTPIPAQSAEQSLEIYETGAVITRGAGVGGGASAAPGAMRSRRGRTGRRTTRDRGRRRNGPNPEITNYSAPGAARQPGQDIAAFGDSHHCRHAGVQSEDLLAVRASCSAPTISTTPSRPTHEGERAPRAAAQVHG